MSKNGFLTFCFSLIPGAGQMYLGLMKRGLSLMMIAGAFGLCMLEIGSFLFIVPFLITMAYSFFDTHHIRGAMKRGETLADDYIIQSTMLKNARGNRLIGFGVLLIGVYLLIDKTMGQLFNVYDLGIFSEIFRAFRRCLPSLIASCLTIGIGVRMIAGNREE